MKRYREYPEEGELVVGRVTKVNPFSGFVYLEEYGKTGMVHISEVARKWVRDIREFLKEGKRVVALVMKVDEKSGHISLSLKRVSKRDAEEKQKEYKLEQKAEKMLELAAKSLGMSLDEAYEKFGFELQKKFGTMFEPFRISLSDPGVLLRKGFSREIVDAIRKAAESSIEIKETEIKGILELSTRAPNGIDLIKKVLSGLEKQGISVKYISAPRYMLSVKSREPKKAEAELKKAAEKAVKEIGSGKFEIF